VDYQKQVVKNAKVLGESLSARGYRLVSGGTDNHLLLVDLREVRITGKEAEKVLDEVGITVNKNAIPFDEEKPTVTSGIRIGTPACTTRGMKEKEMEIIAECIDKALRGKNDPQILSQVKNQVRELCQRFPLYPEITNGE